MQDAAPKPVFRHFLAVRTSVTFPDGLSALALALFAALVLMLSPCVSLAAADQPEEQEKKEEDRVGRVLKLALPITADSQRLVKRFVLRSLDDARRRNARPVLIFVFEVAPGQEDFGRGSQFGASLDMARYLSSDALAGAATVAYLPRSIQGHAVLVAMACDEIIMAPNATIGQAGVDEQVIEEFMRTDYREIANRRRTVPAELALAMLDPTRKVLEVQTELSREFVTPEGVEELAKNHNVANQKVIVTGDKPCQFTGEDGRQLGFVSFLADHLRGVEQSLDLPHGQVEEPVLLADKWTAVRVDLDGLITFNKVDQIKRRIEKAMQQDSANFVCLWINSQGGSPEDSLELARFLLSLPRDKVRTAAYVEGEARSDAALIALACDQLVMRPNALLGGPGAYAMTSSGDIERTRLAVRENFASRRSWSLPAAMVDPTLEVDEYTDRDMAALGTKEYFCKEELEEQPDAQRWRQGPRPVTTRGEQFAVRGDRATELHLADHAVDHFAAFKELYGLESDPMLTEPSWVDQLVRILAMPGVAAFLLMVGGAALYAELHTPGVGLGGFLAVVCFVLFFWAQFIGESATWLEVLLFLCGISCLAIEVFVLPGFGIFGIGGGALVLISLILATQTFFLPRNAYQFHQFEMSLAIVAGAGLGMVVLGALVNRWLPHAPMLNHLMLNPLSDEEKENLSLSESLAHFDSLLGREGVTTTQLTPCGKARFGDQLVDVMADGDLIRLGTRVMVVEIRGNRVMVEPTDKED